MKTVFVCLLGIQTKHYENIFISIILFTAYQKMKKNSHIKNKVTLGIVPSLHGFASDVAKDIFADYGLSAA